MCRRYESKKATDCASSIKSTYQKSVARAAGLAAARLSSQTLFSYNDERDARPGEHAHGEIRGQAVVGTPARLRTPCFSPPHTPLRGLQCDVARANQRGGRPAVEPAPALRRGISALQ